MTWEDCSCTKYGLCENCTDEDTQPIVVAEPLGIYDGVMLDMGRTQDMGLEVLS